MPSRNRKEWRVLYEHWKQHHPGMDKEARKFRVRMCQGKFGYVDFLVAMNAATRLHLDTGAKCHPYFCEICNKHHVGRANSKPIFPRERPTTSTTDVG